MHILLKYSENYKGILIVTHKEIGFSLLNTFLMSIAKIYFILIHNGSVNSPQYPPYLTYNLTTIANKQNNKCLPFTSRNFLDKVFNNNEDSKLYSNFKILLKKYNLEYNTDNIAIKDSNINISNKLFDFICVNRSNQVKKTYDLLIYVTNYAKNNKDSKNCFIIIEDNINNPYYIQIINYYNNNKLDNILFINAVNFNNELPNIFKGLTRNELALLYKLSKVYMHACESEGESRTIHEALCCGCMVLAKQNMCGGGLDYINNTNGLLYNHNNYLIQMKTILNLYKNYKYNNLLYQNLSEIYTTEKFLKLLYDNLYSNSKISFNYFKDNCNINNLMDKLPGHDISEAWFIPSICKWGTADIKTLEQIKILQKYL
jgi:hypothetical protein